MKMNLKATAVIALALPALSACAYGQLTGVSHPEEVPITTNSEGISQPVVYQPTPTTLKVRQSVEVTPVATKPVLTASTAAATATPADAAAVARASDDVKPLTRNNADSDIVTRVGGASNQLPVGTLLKARIAQELNTRETKAGAVFTAELTEAIVRDGRVLVPAGSILSGRVTDVHGGRRVTGSASIHLQPTHVTLPDGTRYTVRAQVIDTQLFKTTRVDDEGTIIRRDYAVKTLSAMTLSTGSGAAAGAVLGGWPGALVGAGVGAGVSTVVWLKQDRQTEVPANTGITFALSSPMTVGAE